MVKQTGKETKLEINDPENENIERRKGKPTELNNNIVIHCYTSLIHCHTQ